MATGRARIAVSILDADHSNMGFAVRRAQKEGADRIHIDVMDGHFVPNLTFGPKMIAGLRKRTKLPLDAHLMISNPLKYIDEFLDAICFGETSTWKVTESQPASRNSSMYWSGSLIIRWASSGSWVRGRMPLIIFGPNVRFGTKWPSMTSMWKRSAPSRCARRIA